MLEQFTDDQQKLMITIIASLPFAFLLTYIKTPIIRKTINLLVGFSLQISMYRESYLNVVASIFIVYLLTKLVKRSIVGYVIMFYSFLHLSLLHLYRQIYDYGSWRMDITTIFMILSLKNTAFGFSFQDGFEASIKENNIISEVVDKNYLKYIKPYKINSFKIEDYIGYVVFFPTGLMGPFVDFNVYKEFIYLENKDFQNLPNTLIPTLKRFSQAMFFIVMYISFKDVFTVNFFLKQTGYVKLLGFCLLLFQKFKYYIAFLLSESICIASGITFQRISNNNSNTSNINKEIDSFDRILNVKVLPCETEYSAKAFFQNWNISVHNFLKRNIYFRVLNKDRSNSISAQILTFFVSAIWHGFYPSYYFLFSHFALGLVIELQFNKIKEIYNSRSCNITLDVIFKVGFFIVGNYCVGVVESLDYVVMFNFMRQVYFSPTILLFVAYVINYSIIKTNNKNKRADKKTN